MIALHLDSKAPVVALGAHADDIEIGCGGTLMRMAREVPDLEFRFAVATSDDERAGECLESARRLLGNRVSVVLGGFRDGFLPYDDPAGVKSWLREVFSGLDPQVVLSPWRNDPHQDHRLLGELAWQVFRRSTVLEYEVPKWEAEPFEPNFYVPIPAEDLDRKLAHMATSFPSQQGKPWYDPELFRATMRLRGVEHGRTDHAEAFVARKLTLAVEPT